MRPLFPPRHWCPCSETRVEHRGGIARELVNRLRNAREVGGDNVGQDEDTRVAMHDSPFVRPYQPCVVEQTVVIAVIRQQRPSPLGGKEQLSGVGRTFAPLFVGRRNMVPMGDKEMRQPQGYILIEVERRHLRRAVRGEAGVNRLRMLPVVCECRIHGLP